METSKEKVQWLEYDLFEPFSTFICKTYLRHGGFSTGPFAALNTSDEVGDRLETVKANRALISKDLNANALVFLKQRHGDKIVEITKDNLHEAYEADGFYTKEKHVALAITHADCQAAIFYAPKHGVIAAVHAGWKGQAIDIYGKMVNLLKEKYQILPEELFVIISPSLCPLHAEFKNYQEELPEKFWSFQSKEKPKHFNLWKIAIMQLTEAGVKEGQIEVAQSCTFCEEEDFYSHRRDKQTGRLATVAILN